MTEQFTPEYIRYIRAEPENEDVLQVRCPQDMRGAWVLILADETTEVRNLGETGWQFLVHTLLRDGAAWLWLPTLWQLLQIIEGAGWDWQRQGSALGILRCLGYHEETDEYEWEAIPQEIEGDIMLAAAKLATRAIGEGE